MITGPLLFVLSPYKWINIDKELQTTELVTEEDISGEIQSKRPKENVAGDSDGEKPDEKPSVTKRTLDAPSNST